MADRDEPVFAATLTDVRHFTTLLRSVAFQQRVKVVASEAGLMVQVEEARSLQCRSYIPSNTFSSYTFNPRAAGLNDGGFHGGERPDEDDVLTPPPPPDVALEINLSHLIECLNIFGGAGGGAGGGGGVDGGEGRRKRGDFEGDDDDEDGGGFGGRRGRGGGGEGASRTGKVTAGRISWLGPGEPLEVLLMDENAGPSAPTTTCSLSTSEADFESDIEFPEDEEPALHIICAASWLRDALASLDPSSTKVALGSLAPPPSATFFTPDRSNAGAARDRAAEAGGETGIDFRIESEGTWGDVRIDFENKKPLCLSFVRTRSVRHTYRKTLLQRSLRALAASHKVSLILYPSGVLFLQCMLVAPPQPEAGNYTEAERARRRAEREMRKRGEVTDGIVELRMMSLEEESDDEQ